MLYAFIDESGDLGVKGSSSRWFVLVMLVISNKRLLEHAVKKVRRSLGKKIFIPNELHAYHENDLTRSRVLKRLNAIDGLSIYAVILDKNGKRFRKEQTSQQRYCFAVESLVTEFSARTRMSDLADIEIVIDKRGMGKKPEEYLRGQIRKLLPGIGKASVSVAFEESHNEKSLQMADFTAWSVFRKHEYGDAGFYELIKSKMSIERIVE